MIYTCINIHIYTYIYRPTIPERVKLALDFIGELQTFGHK